MKQSASQTLVLFVVDILITAGSKCHNFDSRLLHWGLDALRGNQHFDVLTA